MSRIVVCSGEASGDAMVKELVPALRARFGAAARLSVLTSTPIDDLQADEILCPAPEAVLGFSVGGARRWGGVLEEVWTKVAPEPPDLFIGVSHHGFNLVLATELKALAGEATKTLMVAPPEVWAWEVRSWLRVLGPILRWLAPSRRSIRYVISAMLDRGRSTIQAFDGIACLLEPNLKAYRRLDREHAGNTLVTKVGHPFARYADPGEQQRVRDAARVLRETLAPSPDDLLVGLFPGSREAEVERLLPLMLVAIDRIRGRFGDRLKPVATASDERRAEQIGRMLDEHSKGSSLAPVGLVTGQAEAALAAADFGLLCSGTVTLHAASLGLPSVVVYDLGWSMPRRLLAHLVLRRGRVSSERGADHVGFALPSAVLGERIFSELSIGECKPRRIAKALAEMIGDEDTGERLREHQQRLLALLQPATPGAERGSIDDTPMQRVARIGLQLVTGSPERA